MQIRRLYVLFDAECAFCQRCVRWLRGQPLFVPLIFRARQSSWSMQRYGRLLGSVGADELLVISDVGGVYRGPDAYLMCLWATVRWREWAMRLARPLLRPLAGKAFELLARHREGFSRWMQRADDRELARGLSDPGPAGGRGTGDVLDGMVRARGESADDPTACAGGGRGRRPTA